MAPTQTMQDCDLAEALAFQLVFGGDECPPKIFYCIWHVLKAVRANMKKCGEPCRPGGPCEKFAAAGPTHANEKLNFLLSWDVQEILQYAKAACTFDNGYRKLARPKVRGQGAIVFNLCWNAE